MRAGFIAALAGLVLAVPVPLSAQEVASAPGAVLRGLDKVAGASSDIELATGQTAAYGRLAISLTECRHPASNPAADAFAHVVITDPFAPEPVFSGWMIASSPAVNALDHTRYDVWLLRCTTS